MLFAFLVVDTSVKRESTASASKGDFRNHRVAPQWHTIIDMQAMGFLLICHPCHVHIKPRSLCLYFEVKERNDSFISNFHYDSNQIASSLNPEMK